jgi:release factor H-coupled RctB family protein
MPADTPPTPTVIRGEGVWIDPEALAQLAAVSALEGCVAAAGMPDLHPGRGLPIGAVVATHDVVYPRLVGGDAGCGARVVVTDLARPSLDKLERRVRAAFEDAPFAEADPDVLFAAVWADGARGLASVAGVPESLRALAEAEPVSPQAGLAPWASGGAGYVESLGTIGGGNHFAEVSRVETVADAALAEAAGLVRGAVVVLVHTGSRGLGAALAAKWGAETLRGDAVAAYMADLAGACHFAQANRLVLTWRLRSALGALRATSARGGFDVVHNDVRAEGGAWVHRKGAAPAYPEGLTVVLGSRGAPSWVVQGTGSAMGLRSVAHGAGRRMGRAEALRRGKARYQRSELTRSATGARLLCDDPDLLYEEHPDAYKAIEPVMAALEAHGLARRVASLEPLVTVKL